MPVKKMIGLPVCYGSNYLVHLTDGYIIPSPKELEISKATGRTIEDIIAEHLYHLGKQIIKNKRLEKRGIPIFNPLPKLLHVWVVGRPNWTEGDVSDLIKRIYEPEEKSNYRIFIVGEGVPPMLFPHFDDEEVLYQSWRYKAYLAGMKKRKVRRKIQLQENLFHDAWPLLWEIHEYYSKYSKPASEILTKLNIPFSFKGD